jgi:hypothetical protein
LIVHCTAGKDRTGVICALVLSLCGVDDEVVAQEYALTEIGLTTEWKNGVIEHLMGNPALNGNMAGALNMISARFVPLLHFVIWTLMFSQSCKYAGYSENAPREIRRG